MMDCMMDGGCTMGMWGMLAMGLFWIALIALVVWGLYRLFATRRGKTLSQSSPPDETPRATLDRRYAHGDLSTQDYEERRRKLDE